MLLSGCGYLQDALPGPLDMQPQLISTPLAVKHSTFLKPRARPCACPADRDELGQLCGRRSAWSRSRGKLFSCTGRLL